MAGYRLKVRALTSRTGDALYRRYQTRRGREALPAAELIRRNVVAGRTFADLGGMWGINGEHSFLAEQAGAARVVLVDTWASEEFERRRTDSGSSVEFVQGDVTSREVLRKVGEVDVVWCFGLLYHLPNPLDLLVALRDICTGTLVLETLTVPERSDIGNSAVYLPMLGDRDRRIWSTRRAGGARVQLGITQPFEHEKGYANNYWAMSPSCVRALLATADFRVTEWRPSLSGASRHVFVADIADRRLHLG
jgi:hypothetical protein